MFPDSSARVFAKFCHRFMHAASSGRVWSRSRLRPWQSRRAEPPVCCLLSLCGYSCFCQVRSNSFECTFQCLTEQAWVPKVVPRQSKIQRSLFRLYRLSLWQTTQMSMNQKHWVCNSDVSFSQNCPAFRRAYVYQAFVTNVCNEVTRGHDNGVCHKGEPTT